MWSLEAVYRKTYGWIGHIEVYAILAHNQELAGSKSG
jgi:hypothetical protein